MKRIYRLLIFGILILPVTGLSLIHANAQDSDDILVGHLTYHTGPFAEVGPQFDGITDFTLGIINQDPPLGRDLFAIHEDIGTIGEAKAARKLVEFEGVEVLLNPAHNYSLYQEWILEFISNNNRPLMPSVHGGAIDREIGGIANEPLFRGSPMDSAQSVAAVIQAKNEGAESIVIVATQIDGHQLQKDAAVHAASELGLEILSVIDIQTELPNYLAEANEIQVLEPDAILILAPALDGAMFVKNLAEADNSSMILGTSDWLFPEFLTAATDSAIEYQQSVWITGYAHTDSPAWDYYESQWNDSEYVELASADNSYNLQYYDLLIVTALAIEAAGTTDADIWVEYVPSVSESPGRVVYTYQEGIEALRNGEDIDYSGVSGDMNYNETGVVSGLFGIFEWEDGETLSLVTTIDELDVLALDS